MFKEIPSLAEVQDPTWEANGCKSGRLLTLQKCRRNQLYFYSAPLPPPPAYSQFRQQKTITQSRELKQVHDHGIHGSLIIPLLFVTYYPYVFIITTLGIIIVKSGFWIGGLGKQEDCVSSTDSIQLRLNVVTCATL